VDTTISGFDNGFYIGMFDFVVGLARFSLCTNFDVFTITGYKDMTGNEKCRK